MLRGFNAENGEHAHVVRLFLSEGPAPDHVEIGETSFLFSAHFKKSGADLILTGDDGHKLVLVDYFNLTRRPDLTSHGATMSADLVTRLAGPDAPGQYAQAGAPAGAQVIGKCERLGGGATVQHANGVTEELKVNDVILKGDVVMTSDGSSAVLSLSDGTVFNMGASARMVLSELIYDANSTSNSAVVSLVKGTFSFVAGHVAHTGDMKLDTPVAAMGIRGTAGTTIINADASGAVYEVDFSLMPDPDGHVGLIQVLDRVTGLVIGTISTTANVLSVQPTANFQVIAQESPKAAAQVQAELNAAQILYPVYQAIAATVPAPTAPPASTGPQGGQPNTSPPGGSSTPPQDLPPVISIQASVNADTGAVAVTKLSVDSGPSTTITPPTQPAPTNPPITTPTNPTPETPAPHTLALVPDSAVVREGTNSIASGNLFANDSNSGSLFVTGVVHDAAADGTFTVDGTFGTLVVHTDGAYTYTLAETSSQQAALSAGGGLDDFTYAVSDGNGGTGSAHLAVTVTRDAPPVIVASLTTAAGTIAAVPLNSDGTPLTSVAASYLAHGNVLVNGLGGPTGFGANALAVGDDNSSSAVDITSVFGPQGLNFFGHNYTSLYINNNGNITLAAPTGQFTPSQITAGANNPIIAPFWADVDTRGGAGTGTGGNSTGSNQVNYNLDTANGVLTVTWDDVGYYSAHNDKLDAFQVQLISLGNGNFDIVYRYQNISWTTGDASGGSGGLGGQVARAGYSAGDGVHYFELPQSGDQAQMLALPGTPGDTSIAGLDVFEVDNGIVLPTTLTASGDIVFTDPDNNDTHSITNIAYTGPGASLGTLSVVKDSDISPSSDSGRFTWTYSATPASLASLAPGEVRTETFDVTISDSGGASVVQTVTVTLTGVTQGPSVTGITLGSALLDGSTPSTTITVNFSEKVTDFTGTDLVLPAGVALSNGVLAASGLSFTATLTAGANIADESHAIAVTGGSYHDANGNAGAAFTGPSLEVNTLPVLTVGVSVVGNGNPAVQEGQTLVATATISNDPADVGATINYQWQSSSDGGLTWSNVGGALSGGFTGGLSSFLQLTEGNEGQHFRVQSSFTDSGGQLISATSSPTVAVADVTPVITAPFSYAVDALSIVKNGTQIYNNTFSQAPPSSPTILSNGVPLPIVFLTLGSTWTEAGGKAILSSTGLAPNTVVSGSDWDLALLNTNTDPTSTLGLKEGAAFTVNSTFDLTASPAGNYGMELTDGTSTHSPDQVVRLVVQGSNGNTVVELVQANLATSPGTSTVLASQTLTAAQLANNNQIEFQLSHVANSTAITGTFELLSGGNVTSTTTFTSTATIFTNGVNWTRVDIGAFTSPGVALNVAAGQSPLVGQTLTASASTNDNDATINYQWQESSSASFATVTNIGTNSATYVVQPSDEGSFIRVVATTSDPDNAQSAIATSSVSGAALQRFAGDATVSNSESIDLKDNNLASATVSKDVGITSNHFDGGNELGSFIFPIDGREGTLAVDPPVANKHSATSNPSTDAIERVGSHDSSPIMHAASYWENNSSHKGHFDTPWTSDFVSRDGVDAASIGSSSRDLGNFVFSSDGHDIVDQSTATKDPVISDQSTVTRHDADQVHIESSSENGGAQEQDITAHWNTDRLDHLGNSISQSTKISFGMDLAGRDNFVFQSTSTGGTLARPASDFGNHDSLSGYLHGSSQNEPLSSALDQHWHDVMTDLQQGQQSSGTLGSNQSQLQAIVSATTSENHTVTQPPDASAAIGEMIAQLNASHDFLIHH